MAAVPDHPVPVKLQFKVCTVALTALHRIQYILLLEIISLNLHFVLLEHFLT